MLGMTPFAGIGVVEFNGAVDALRIDSRLVREPEPPIVYVAVAGTEPVAGLGYALVQLPSASDGTSRREEVTRISDVRAEEIEELRARLRRAAEDRAILDTENARLRRALTEADETVMNLTRRTTEEMAAVADRLAAGLRAPAEAEARAAAAALAEAREEADRLRVRLAEGEARAAAAEQRLEEVATRARERQTALEDALERQRLAESDLARARRELVRVETEAKSGVAQAKALEEKTRAIAERDDRILRLEEEKQDLAWRLAELEDKLRQSIARAVQAGAGRGEGARPAAVEPSAPPRRPRRHAAPDPDAGRAARERAHAGLSPRRGRARRRADGAQGVAGRADGAGLRAGRRAGGRRGARRERGRRDSGFAADGEDAGRSRPHPPRSAGGAGGQAAPIRARA